MSEKYTLHHGDCLEFMATLPDGSVDACVTDPPYGVDWDTTYTRFSGGFCHPQRKNHLKIASDSKAFDPAPFLRFPKVVMFGANCFSDKLPCGSWFIWDKRFKNGTAFLADGEAAWFNCGHGVYIASVTSQGFIRPEKIEHPTQKPVEIMRWIIEKVTKRGDTIFDPFMGSGTTGVAAMETGRRFIGCELDPGYFAIAQRRIAAAAAQGRLFDAPAEPKPPAPVALELFEVAAP